MAWDILADDATIAKTIDALKTRGITGMVVENGQAAKAKVLEIIPKDAWVMHASSVTLETIGLIPEIDESGKYKSVKNQLKSMDRATQRPHMLKLGSAPEWIVGSVHAVTQDGIAIIASNTGSQLPGYAHGAEHVIWVVGAQKIVPNLDEAMKRLYEYVYPLEDKHMRTLYNVGSNVSKLLIFQKEIVPNRVTLIFVKEKLGF
jgi:hypothetical protein